MNFILRQIFRTQTLQLEFNIYCTVHIKFIQQFLKITTQIHTHTVYIQSKGVYTTQGHNTCTLY